MALSGREMRPCWPRKMAICKCLVGLRLLYVTTRVQKVRFKRKKPRDHEENKSKKYSVIKYKGLEEKMSLLVFFSEKVFLMKCNNMWLYAL